MLYVVVCGSEITEPMEQEQALEVYNRMVRQFRMGLREEEPEMFEV